MLTEFGCECHEPTTQVSPSRRSRQQAGSRPFVVRPTQKRIENQKPTLVAQDPATRLEAGWRPLATLPPGGAPRGRNAWLSDRCRFISPLTRDGFQYPARD